MSAALQSAFAQAHPLASDDTLGRFVRAADPEAFAAIVRRYGPVVYAVCLRVLGNAPDADDAFQATFLVLLRKANRVKAESLGGWLFTVAHRTDVYARMRRAARRTQPLDSDVMHTVSPPPTSDLLAALDVELANLPAKYRESVVRCELDGQTVAEAAKALQVPVGTVASRLARGRALLAERLQRRGFAVAAVGVSVLLAGSASARVPAKLLMATIAGEPVGTVSELVTETLKMLLVSKLKLTAKMITATILIAAGVAAVGLGGTQPVAHAAPVPKESLEVRGKKLEELWAMLTQDEPICTRGMLALSARPKQELTAFLADKLKPLKLSEERARKLLTDLGNEKEETAQAAYDELSYFDPRLVLLVDEIMKGFSDGVHQRRVMSLLAQRGLKRFDECEVEFDSSEWWSRKEGRKMPASYRITKGQLEGGGQGWLPDIPEPGHDIVRPKWIQATRAITILEIIDTPEAVKVLESMASGHEDASPTRAAKEALERLKKK